MWSRVRTARVAGAFAIIAVLTASARASEPWTGLPGITQTTAEVMVRQQRAPEKEAEMAEWEKKIPPDRSRLPQDPRALDVVQWPPAEKGAVATGRAPQTQSVTFNAVTGPTETGAFPPDTMGTIGPTQFVLFVNGRIRSFARTGTADGVLNADPDVFFAPVVTPPGPGEVSFTSDPRIRYDRLTGRWILVIIDVTLNPDTEELTDPNRVLIATSDTATITNSTVWTLFQFRNDQVAPAGNTNQFADYPTLGVDANALYIGVNMFTLTGPFVGTSAFVVRKSSVLNGGPIVATAFRNLVPDASSAGPYTPQGVDNYDPASTEGYFIGVDNLAFGALDLRRVSDPGGSPAISGNIQIVVPSTQFPLAVPHLGNVNGNAGRLDALDDPLSAAHIRDGKLWTAHNIGVTNTGSTSGTRTRNAVRWYELGGVVSPATPAVVQSGTLFDPTAPNDTSQISYWIPSIMVSGQGHAALGFSQAGAAIHIDAATTGRLATDPLGTIASTPPFNYTSSATAYNPGTNRWGDYSYTSLDPLDDMTMWTVQEYCNGANTYGARVVQLLAPAPALPCASPKTVGTPGHKVSLLGTGFYDPGPDLPPPAVSFHHASATVTGSSVVNATRVITPTRLQLDLTVSGSGTRNVIAKNPDSQQITGIACINVDPGTVFIDGFELGDYLDWTTSSP